MKKLILILSAVVIFLTAFYFFWLVPRYTVPILTYHSINCGEGSHFVTPENFAKQMSYIKNKGYKVITLDELVRGINNKEHFKGNEVVITFDDGYKDNLEYAYSVLKKFSFPATIFLISSYIENDKRFLNWDQVRAMSRGGISFGSHTKSHFYLGSAKDERAIFDEVGGSKKIIESEIGKTVNYLCYPTGGFNAKVKEIVKVLGYKGACTTNRGFADFNNDVYELKRVKVTNSDATKPLSFWMKLSGYYNLFRSKKNPY